MRKIVAMLMLLTLLFAGATTASAASTRDVYLLVEDSFGNGWGDSCVRIQNGGTIGEYTLTSGSSYLYTISMPIGQEIEVFFEGYAFNNECSFKLGYDPTFEDATKLIAEKPSGIFLAPGSTMTIGTYTITSPDGSAAELTGTVTITGTEKYGSELIAAVTDTNNTGTLSYQWKRGAAEVGTDSATYTLVEADIGQTLTCTVTSSVQTGSITSDLSGTIAKADGPIEPSCTFSFDGDNAGKLMGSTNLMQYTLSGNDDSGWADCTEDMELTVASITADNDIRVRVKEIGTTKAGAILTIDITKSATPTEAGKTDCTTAANNDGILTGVTALMEWEKNDGAWANGDGTTITGLANGTYYVRVKAVGTVLASDNQELVIAPYLAPAPSHDPGPSYSYYTIKASAGKGGSVSSAGGASYREGRDKTFTVTPDEGCIIFDVLVDGVSVGPVSEYEFEDIQKRHTIEAVFAKGDMANFKLTGEYAGYPDLDEGKWYGTEHEGVIRNATLLGIVEGDGTGFRPEDGIKLSEVVKMAAVVWNTYYGSPYSFDRTEGTHWYDTYVNFSFKYGVIKAGDFADFERNATRAEMAYIFARALPESELAATSTIIPPDVTETDEYAAEIRTLYAAGVLCGNDETGTFTGEREVTRAEAAAIITRMARPSVRIAE